MVSQKLDPRFTKVHFRLEKDSDGYPPDDWEVVWASETEKGLFRIDNIPFFVRGISPGDEVSVESREDGLYFVSLIRQSRTSVLRVFAKSENEVQHLRNSLRALKCESELSHIPRLFSVEVPQTVPLRTVLAFLRAAEKEGRLDFEEAAIRQPTT